jgi:hypothetical protein
VHDRARVALASIRIVNGAIGLVAPSLLTRRVRPLPAEDAAATYAFRLFGVRTVLLGVDLLSRNRAVRDHAVRAAFPIHATDAITAATLGLTRRVSPRTGMMLTSISTINTLLAMAARPRDR